LARAQGYGLGFDRYQKWVNKGSIVIVQIEHIDAINNLEEILRVDGVDGGIIGPYDLSASMGCPGKFGRKDMQAALKKYMTVCEKLRKPAGFHVVNPDAKELKEKVNEGFSFVAFGFDAIFLSAKCRDGLSEIRRKLC
jgi:2-dehydro-3-deoxyglucarate aldolase